MIGDDGGAGELALVDGSDPNTWVVSDRAGVIPYTCRGAGAGVDAGGNDDMILKGENLREARTAREVAGESLWAGSLTRALSKAVGGAEQQATGPAMSSRSWTVKRSRARGERARRKAGTLVPTSNNGLPSHRLAVDLGQVAGTADSAELRKGRAVKELRSVQRRVAQLDVRHVVWKEEQRCLSIESRVACERSRDRIASRLKERP